MGTMDQIKKHSDMSVNRHSASSPWKCWPEEMAKKTVLRKAYKSVPLDFSSIGSFLANSGGGRSNNQVAPQNHMARTYYQDQMSQSPFGQPDSSNPFSRLGDDDPEDGIDIRTILDQELN